MITENLPQRFVLASRKRRIAAFLIDHFIFSFLIVSIVFLALGTDFIDSDNFMQMISTMLFVMVPGFLIYFAKDSMNGISIGKWVMGIMVRDAADMNVVPSFGRLFLRNLFIIISPVEFIVLATSAQKKRLGDKAANTIVLANPNKPSKLPRIITLLGVGVAFILFVFIFTVMTLKNSDAYKISIQAIEQDKEIQFETGGITGYGMMPSGGINITNGNGRAQFVIKVLGNKKNYNVETYLEKKRGGEWTLIKLKKYSL